MQGFWLRLVRTAASERECRLLSFALDMMFSGAVLLLFSRSHLHTYVIAAAEDWGRRFLQANPESLRPACWQSSGAHPQIRGGVSYRYFLPTHRVQLSYFLYLAVSVWCWIFSECFHISYCADCESKGVNSNRLVSCITTLYLFSKIRAQLMVKHAMTMQPYLTTKCNVSIKLSPLLFSLMFKPMTPSSGSLENQHKIFALWILSS